MRVLLVSGQPEYVPAWANGDGRRLEISRAASLRAAVQRLGNEPADVVVIESDAVAGGDGYGELAQLREHAPGVAVLAAGCAVDAALAACVDGVLPDEAAAEAQAKFVELAGERAQLAARLAERSAELQQRVHELDRSRAQFRSVIERNADAILVIDRVGVIRFANAMAAELFRSPRESLIGTTFGFPAVAGETTELDLVHNGDSRVVEMRVVESEWEGEPASIASLRDMTERHRAEAAARTLIREQAARAAADRAAQRFRFLAESANVLSSASLDYHATLAALAQLCVGGIADWAVVYAADDRGVIRRLTVAHRDAEREEAVRALADTPIHPDGTHPVLHVVRTRTPLLMRDVDDAKLAAITEDEAHRDLVRQLGLHSFMLVPLVARDRCLGAMALVSADPARAYDLDDLAQAQDLAVRAALAVDNARLYHEAQDANQAKSDLLAVISHDLRTPLNAIIGYADLLAMGLPEQLSDATLQRIGRIRTSAGHLLYLIDELLSYARLEAGRQELRLEDVDAGQLARDVATVVEPLAQQRHLVFQLAVECEPGPIRTDPDKVRQVLLNLAGNAVKYTEQGEVRLSVRGAGDVIAFAVRDTGVGIRQDDLPHIFEPFWQASEARRSAEAGTGLGLSVVQRLVQLLGGTISVDSVDGRGSTFTVTLPRMPAPDAVETQPAPFTTAHAAADPAH